MKKDNAGNLTFSPSDLILAMQSPFASWMERYAIEQPNEMAEIKRDENALMNLLATRGNSHETNYLNYLIEKHGVSNVGIVQNTSKHNEAKNTLAFMREGKEVIFQARLSRGEFTGKADFLIKVEGKSKFGNYHYEAWDTKLSLSTRPYFLIQLCCYSWMLEEVQEVMPEYATIVLGNLNKNTFRITSYFDYFQRLKKSFIDFQSHFTPDFDAMPDLAECNDYGVWTSFAEHRMKKLDSLVQIANIRKSQIKKIQHAGINTLTELATSTNTTIPRLAHQSFAKIKAQASIQKASEGLDIPKYTVLTENEKEGLYTLPAKSTLDVFFDIEGHPLIEGGLEYLWGVSYQDSSHSLGKYAFKDWWAHTPHQEKLAFEGFIDFVFNRWQRDNNMHVYHYASYEITAMRKISTRYETRGDKLAELLKNDVFIDLYKIVSKGILIGTPSYSIKYVEHLYRNRRNTLIANGGESVVVYESWRENGGVEAWNLNDNGYNEWLKNSENFDWSKWEELNAIRLYNIDDCESTLELTVWLRSIQKENDIQYLNANEIEIAQEPQNNQNPLEIRRQELKNRFESTDDLKNDPIAQLAIDLMGFHHRERKPNVWAYFDRLEKTDEELLDDDTCLCDIEIKTRNGTTYTGIFDNTQPIRTDKLIQNGGKIRGSETKIKIIELSQPNGHTTTIQFSAKQIIDDNIITIFANEPFIRTDKLENRLCDVVEQLFDQKLNNLTNSILKRELPTFNHLNPLPINRQLFPDNNDYLDAIFSAVQAMNHSCLGIQGPPGAGKSYTAKNVITRLVLQGKRIGVTSNSHAAILNLLDGLHESTNHANMVKIGGNQAEFSGQYSYEFRNSMADFTNETYSRYQIIGGTVFAFAHDIAFDAPLDYLFVDEASQVPLANLTAISGAAENIVLIGDQMQLEQPTQGSHPGESGLSALEFMLNGYHVVPEDRGIFLETTYRMHPDVCKPISETVYEGKLHADCNNIHQRISIPFGKLITKHNGILTIDVHHEGNRQSSREEVDLIKDLINELETGTYCDKNGNEHSIIADDIMIVAPYNMQVNLLKENLGDNYAIGTIDKFQGQEAPVVIVSMAVSDPHESSRGVDFVFDINRLNVAISRAKALAIIVANPELKNCRVTSMNQMEKSSFFLKLTSQ
jgi:uncharacterized protein